MGRRSKDCSTARPYNREGGCRLAHVSDNLQQEVMPVRLLSAAMTAQLAAVRLIALPVPAKQLMIIILISNCNLRLMHAGQEHYNQHPAYVMMITPPSRRAEQE